MNMSRTPIGYPTALIVVLLAASLTPVLMTQNGGERVDEKDFTTGDAYLHLGGDTWSAGARSSATSWLHETADSDGTTGQWTSAEMADDGTIWVAFYSAAGRDLKAAHWNGYAWLVEDVYTFGDIGRYAELEIDSSGNPRIASFDVTNSIVRISRYDGTSWDTQSVAPGEDTGDGNPYSGTGRIGFALTSDDSEWFTFQTGDSTTAYSGDYILSFAHWDSSDSSWAYGVVDRGQGEDTDYDDYTDSGQYSTLAIGADGRPRVAYDSRIVNTNGLPAPATIAWSVRSLRYAVHDGAGWVVQDIHINETGDSYKPSTWLDLEIDSNGDEFIAYQNGSSWASIRLAEKPASGSWSHAEIASRSGADLGEYIRMELNSLGDLHIAHHDSGSDDLVLMRGKDATWEEVTIASTGSVGSYGDIVLNANDDEVFSYHDYDNGDLLIASPAPDGDGDGLADAQDRCLATPAGKVIDDSGCHYEQQILTDSGEDSQYVDVIKGPDGLLRLSHFRGMSDPSEWSCDREPTNMTDDCNLVYRKQNQDGTWGAAQLVDQGGETGRYNSIAIAPDGSESIAYHAKTEVNSFGFVIKTAARVATLTGTQWTIETISEDNSTGWYTDLAIDSQGNRIVSYTDNSGQYSVLKVARETGPNTWVEEVVQVNGTFARVDYVNDVAHVSYYSSNPHMLRMAIEDGNGGWVIHNVTTSGQVGTYRLDTAVSDNGTLFINYFRGTDSSGDTTCDAPQECTVQVAEWTSAGFNYKILHQDTSENIAYLSVQQDSAGLLHSAWYNSGYGSIQMASPTSNSDTWETLTLKGEDGGTYPKLLVDENGWEQVWYHGGDPMQLREIKRHAWEADHDFVIDANDNCPDTPYGAPDIDIWGCSDAQRDDDYDGTYNGDDLCPDTPAHERHLADGEGCSPSQKDSDEDGVNDAQDLCPGTTYLDSVDATGCSDEQRDSDGDGVNDLSDQCAETPTGEGVDLNGCGESQRDNDGDGVSDKDDFMPLDATQQSDSDGDGYGDNPDGTDGDDCPTVEGYSTGDMQGCPDYDQDGLADEIDDDDDGDGFSDADEIANGTDPLYALDFPGLGEDDGSGDGGADGSDGTGDGNGDGGGDGGSGAAEPEGGGVSMALVGGIAAVFVLLLIVVAALLLTGGKKSGTAMPAIPSLAEAEAALNAGVAAGHSGATPDTATQSSSGGSQSGEMIPTGKPCTHCGAMQVHHIPAYGADYCKACSQYN